MYEAAFYVERNGNTERIIFVFCRIVYCSYDRNYAVLEFFCRCWLLVISSPVITLTMRKRKLSKGQMNKLFIKGSSQIISPYHPKLCATLIVIINSETRAIIPQVPNSCDLPVDHRDHRFVIRASSASIVHELETGC